MERNFDTIRELLARVEKCTLPAEMVRLADFPEEKRAEAAYHMALLIEAGLVKGQMSQSVGPGVKDFIAQRLTWQGHEFLDTIRSDTVWNKTKKKFGEAGMSMSLELAKGVAKEVAAQLLRSMGGS